MTKVSELSKKSPNLVVKIQPAIARIQKAHTLLEFEGISLPPFQPPKREAASKSSIDLKPKPATRRDVASMETSSTTPNPFSFTNAVAPILDKRCGKCHIDGSRGGFSMTSFAVLMKGPPEGVVVFPGDNIGSRLIETIETGDMPRGGGRVPANELAVLKSWISKGALFDGNDPTVSIRAGNGQGSPSSPANAETPITTMKATGKETVSFARDVAGLLVANCNGCHIDAMQIKGGLDMNSFAALLKGGDSGSMVKLGDAEASLLIKKLRGTEGDRMPAGGRPALSNNEIQLIATWINEGATLDGASDRQPLPVMNQLAWAANASASELSEKRSQTAATKLNLVVSGETATQPVRDRPLSCDGNGIKENTLNSSASSLKSKSKSSKALWPDSDASAEAFYRGKATIYVLPKRYDYSEFSKMVEQRSVPSQWQSHWKYNGIDAYVAMVATERDSEKEIESRLVTPLTALAVATRGYDVPRWFAEGVGVVTSMRNTKSDREESIRRESETAVAISVMKDANGFLGGKMSPKQADQIGAAIANTMLSRNQRRNYDQLLRELNKGIAFDAAFASVFRMNPKAYIDAWLKYVR